jgi:hypothetical protein
MVDLRGDVLIAEFLDAVPSSGLYILQFEQGRPKVVAKERIVAGVSVSEQRPDEGSFLLIEALLKDGPGDKVKRWRLRFL